MFKSYKYRLYPDLEQTVKIDNSISTCRFIYNLALETKISAYKCAGVNLSSFQLIKQLTELKREYPWIAKVDSQALQAAVMNTEMAFNNFFKGFSGYPKFKKKKNHGTFQCPNGMLKIDWLKSTMDVPKIKKIPILLSRRFYGKIKMISISRTSTGKYFASLLIEEVDNIFKPKKPTGIGIDLGLTHFASLSDGRKIENPRFLRKDLKRLKTLQRRATRKIPNSENQKKAYLKLNLLHEKIANSRKDFVHKTSIAIIKDSQFDYICIENLPIANMVKCRSLSLSIIDSGWSEFVRQLEYKAKWHGKSVIKVDRFFASSKICSNCNCKLNNLSLFIREWTCPNCGEHHDRDINAAVNIRNSGMGSPGGPVELPIIVGAVKQELIPRGYYVAS